MNEYNPILKYLKALDTEMLDLILTDGYLYQGVKKSTFLYELDKIFEKWKQQGDTNLKIEKGRCLCPKCQKVNLEGWTLIGNNTSNYLNLMFNVLDGKVRDIYHCRTWYEEGGNCKIYEFENENKIKTFAFYEINLPNAIK
jgi:hypothetical protein